MGNICWCAIVDINIINNPDIISDINFMSDINAMTWILNITLYNLTKYFCYVLMNLINAIIFMIIWLRVLFQKKEIGASPRHQREKSFGRSINKKDDKIIGSLLQRHNYYPEPFHK